MLDAVFLWACHVGNYPIVKMLKNRVNTSYGLHLASEQGHLLIVKLLINTDLLIHGVINNYPAIIAKIPNPHRQDQYALRYATEFGFAEMTKILLTDPRVDPSIWYQWPIRRACRHGHLEVVDLLLNDSRTFPDRLGFHSACRHGHVAVVDRLLKDNRLEVSSQCLYHAIGHPEVIQRLLNDPRVFASQMRDPIHYFGYEIITEYLDSIFPWWRDIEPGTLQFLALHQIVMIL